MLQQERQDYMLKIDRYPLSFRNFPEEARDDREMVKYALDKNPFNMWYLSDRLKNDKDYAIDVLSKYPTFHLNKLSSKLQEDKEMVMFAMKRNETYDLTDLEHTCKRFSEDKEVMDLAEERMKMNPTLVPGEIQIGMAVIAGYQGKERALEEVSKDPEIYRLLRQEFKEDKDIAMLAVTNMPELVTEVPAKFQNTEFYAAVIQKNDSAEMYLPYDVVNEIHKEMKQQKNLADLSLKDRLNMAKQESKKTEKAEQPKKVDKDAR